MNNLKILIILGIFGFTQKTVSSACFTIENKTNTKTILLEEFRIKHKTVLPRSNYFYKKNTSSLKITIISYGSLEKSFLQFILPDAEESSCRFTIKNIDVDCYLSISKNTMPFKYLVKFPSFEDSIKINRIDLLNDDNFDTTKSDAIPPAKKRASHVSGYIADDEDGY